MYNEFLLLWCIRFNNTVDLSPALSPRKSLFGLYPYHSSMIGLENLGDPSGNWDIVETIGKGTYGKVYRVNNKKDGSQAAVKVLDPVNVSHTRGCWLKEVEPKWPTVVARVGTKCSHSMPYVG